MKNVRQDEDKTCGQDWGEVGAVKETLNPGRSHSSRVLSAGKHGGRRK
jgi:hypothetical protein